MAPSNLLPSIWANNSQKPPGAICTMVVPVPYGFALLLKLLTRIWSLTKSVVSGYKSNRFNWLENSSDFSPLSWT